MDRNNGIITKRAFREKVANKISVSDEIPII